MHEMYMTLCHTMYKPSDFRLCKKITYTHIYICMHIYRGFTQVCQLYLTALYIESVMDSSLGNTIVHSSRLTSLPVGESRLLTLGSLFNCPAYSLWALHLRNDGCFGNPLSRVFSSFILWMLKPLVLCVRFSDCSLRPVYLVLKGNSRNMRRAGLNW